jgi:hypothetical protein
MEEREEGKKREERGKALDEDGDTEIILGCLDLT